nr:immunoglobulin light chain junction region [Macaca mulatta]MPN66431.1 immunoglobulin light chain junction region [Macaca mulatta]MPN68964.1 immunoglobulin light chain junction region [Macaca mulatta]
CVIGHSSGDVF